MLVLVLAPVLAAGLLTGCGGGHPATAAAKRRGAGGVAYQWPPTDTAGPPSAARFCRLLIDDFQHLKSLRSGSTTGQRAQVIDGFVGYLPAVERAAPPAVASAAGAYLQAESAVLEAAVRAGFDFTRFDRSTLTAVQSPPVATAGAQLEAYSKGTCHYDLSAHPAFGAQG